MAYLNIEFFSNSLLRTVSFKMFIPNDPKDGTVPCGEGKMKTLFLLHGYTGSSYFWGYEELAAKYNFAMVMPSGENAFYLDGEATGCKYCTYVGEELVGYIRRTFGLALCAEDTFVCGLSMGGFGALHTALSYPQNFSKAGAMSSALIIHEIAGMKQGDNNGVANYDYFKKCFGDLESVVQSRANPETLVKQLKRSGEPIPEIYMCCGTEDFLLENNRSFHNFLNEQNVRHIYRESKGSHDGVFWGEYTPRIIDWMFGDQQISEN